MFMKNLLSFIAVPLLTIVSSAYANSGPQIPLPSIVLTYTGYAQPNNSTGPLPAAFYTYCDNNSCEPTTTFPLIDGVLGVKVGQGYAWAKGFTSDPTGT